MNENVKIRVVDLEDLLREMVKKNEKINDYEVSSKVMDKEEIEEWFEFNEYLPDEVTESPKNFTEFNMAPEMDYKEKTAFEAHEEIVKLEKELENTQVYVDRLSKSAEKYSLLALDLKSLCNMYKLSLVTDKEFIASVIKLSNKNK